MKAATELGLDVLKNASPISPRRSRQLQPAVRSNASVSANGTRTSTQRP